MKDSIIFYKSFYEAIKELPKENQIELYNAIFEKYFYDNDPDLKGITKGIFKIIIPNIDSANKRYFANKENGKKGGRPKTNKNPIKTQIKPNKNPIESKKNLNVNDNVNVNVNDNNKEIYKEIINYLNLRANKHFKYTQNNIKKIKARFNEGFTKEDFVKVIDNKCNEWLNDNQMNNYLRPETLFGTKFESYLNQKQRKLTTKDLDIDISDF